MRRELFKQFYVNSAQHKDIDPNVWLLNYVIDRMEMNEQQVLWLCFLNAITYHAPTALLIWNEFPDLECAGIARLEEWWTKDVQLRLPFQSDKLKQRRHLPETVESYKRMVGSDQVSYFEKLLSGSAEENFDKLWTEAFKPIRHFGRFSVWNWAQTLKQVAGYDIEPTTLFLGDKDAESITHGACWVLGKEEEWAYKNRWKDESGKKHKDVHKFSADEKVYLETGIRSVMQEIRDAHPSVTVDAFNVETVMCAFKKLFRQKDSRYIGYYLDRQRLDIDNTASKHWVGVEWKLLYDARTELLQPSWLNDSIDKTKFKLTVEEKIL
tara:strand:+ start:371 stop:1342 length:972 start_codon:yes stop_codon:yes gene_type:complete